jgi:hypothetical protein
VQNKQASDSPACLCYYTLVTANGQPKKKWDILAGLDLLLTGNLTVHISCRMVRTRDGALILVPKLLS